jgi:outer membrane protein
MKNIIISAILLVSMLSLGTTSAQTTGGNLTLNHLTLDEAIQWGVNNSPTLISGMLKLKKEEQELSRIRLSKIPDINISGDLRRNLVIPTTPIPASMMNPAADPDQMVYMKFNTGWNSTAGINLSLDIFNPASYGQTMEQKIQNKISAYDLQISENDVRTEIAKSYAACVISQNQVESVSNDTAYYSKSLAEAEILYGQKKISLTDRNNALIAWNTSIIQYRNAVNVLNEAKANLLYLLGEEVSTGSIDSLHLTEDIRALYAKMNPAAQGYINGNIVEGLLTTGFGLSRQSEVIALTQSRIKTSRLKMDPSLSLKGFYGSNYYNNGFNPGDVDFWHGNSYMAISLKIPVTQAFTINKEISQLKLQEQIEKENLRDRQNLKSKELMEAGNQLIVSMKEYEMFGQNYELSVENLNASRVQLDKAYIQDKDYLEERARCSKAYQSFLQAAYNVFMKTIDLQKLASE